jgi:hypothetical protein
MDHELPYPVHVLFIQAAAALPALRNEKELESTLRVLRILPSQLVQEPDQLAQCGNVLVLINYVNRQRVDVPSQTGC